MKKQNNQQRLFPISAIMAAIFLLGAFGSIFARTIPCGEKDYECQITEQTRAIRANPNDANAYINRGNAYDDSGNSEAAINDYNQAVKLDPNSYYGYYNRGITLYFAGRYKESSADLRKSLEIQPDSPKAQEYLDKANAKLQSASQEKKEKRKAFWKGLGEAVDQMDTGKTTANKDNNAQVETAQNTGNNSRASASTRTLAGLVSTQWALLSLTKKGDQVQEQQNPPDLQFCKDGSWSLLHYGNYAQGGKYQLAGSHLVMRYDDGSVYADAQISLAGDILTMDDGDFVYRLKYIGTVGC